MEELIRINLPNTKYVFKRDGLLFKIAIPDFGKLLNIIGQHADPTEKSASEYYLEIRQAMTEAAMDYGSTYTYHKEWQDETGYRHGRDMHINIKERFEKLTKKLDAAEAKYGSRR